MATMTSEKKVSGMAQFFSQIESVEDLERVIPELLTDSEIDKIHERLKILQCLDEGFSQRETVKRTGAAIATIGRGAQVIKNKKIKILDYIRHSSTQSWWQKFFWCGA